MDREFWRAEVSATRFRGVRMAVGNPDPSPWNILLPRPQKGWPVQVEFFGHFKRKGYVCQCLEFISCLGWTPCFPTLCTQQRVSSSFICHGFPPFGTAFHPVSFAWSQLPCPWRFGSIVSTHIYIYSYCRFYPSSELTAFYCTSLFTCVLCNILYKLWGQTPHCLFPSVFPGSPWGKAASSELKQLTILSGHRGTQMKSLPLVSL